MMALPLLPPRHLSHKGTGEVSVQTQAKAFTTWVCNSLTATLWRVTSHTTIERECALSFKKLSTTVHNVQKTVKLKVCLWSRLKK